MWWLEVLDVLDIGFPDERRIGPLAERRTVDPNVYEVYEVVSGVDDCGDLRSGPFSDRVEARLSDVPASRPALVGVHELLFANLGDDLRPFVVVCDGIHPLAVGRCGHVSKVPLPFSFSGLRDVF